MTDPKAWRLAVLVLALGLPTLLWVPLQAQTVEGRLLEEGTDAPVEGAVVELLPDDTAAAGGDASLPSAVTDAEGHFTLKAPGSGRYRLRAERIGLATTTTPPVDLRAGETLEVEFRVTAEAVPLAPLTVTSDRPPLVRHPRLNRFDFYDRKARFGKEEGMGFGHFLEGEDLRKTASDPTDLLSGLAGVHVDPIGRRDYVVKCRGGTGMSFYIDGTYVGSGSADALNQWVAASDIVGVEVYPGGVGPMAYQMNGGGCLVAVWTGIRREANR